jgi:hypothetical protein
MSLFRRAAEIDILIVRKQALKQTLIRGIFFQKKLYRMRHPKRPFSLPNQTVSPMSF